MSLKFVPHFLQKVAFFFEKVVRRKNIQNLISHKEGNIHSRRQIHHFPFKRGSAPKKSFAIFSENTASFEKAAK